MDNYIEHEGIVVAVNKENVVVRIIQNSACSGCHAKGACSASDTADKEIEAIALDSESFHVGEKVLLRGSDHIGRQAVLIAFVLPFVLMLVMVFLIMFLFNDEGIAGLGAILVLIPYYAILYGQKDKLKKKFIFQVLKLDSNK
ncbi:MAG: SoxR reducing system RseC family protein [Bacteroidales bacterium]